MAGDQCAVCYIPLGRLLVITLIVLVIIITLTVIIVI